MFTGLSAFPLTPFKDEHIDFEAFERLINNLTRAEVDSICALGSTGLYPYLERSELQSLAKRTVELADGIPVMVGIGTLRTVNVLKNAETAQNAGVSAVLLAPVSYHALKEHEVLSLYESVTSELSVPLCVYENPNATNFIFSDSLYREITQLPNVSAIKIPGMPFGTHQGAERLSKLREILPESVSIGVSGDQFGVAGIAAGCDLWLSVLGGLFPNTVKKLIQVAQSNTPENALASSNSLNDLWKLFVANKGGVRVMATAAEILGYADSNCLPRPLCPLQSKDKKALETLLEQLQLN